MTIGSPRRTNASKPGHPAVPLFVAFALLAVAWLLVAFGLRRQA